MSGNTTTKTYLATTLPQVEYDVLDCFTCEESGAMSFAELGTYGILDEYTPQQLADAVNSLQKRGMVSVLFPEGKTIMISTHGKNVIQFAESTAWEVK